MNATTELKKQLLFRDDERISKQMNQATQTAEDLNQFIKKAETVMRCTFDLKEKMLIREDAHAFIKNKVSEWSQFPNSTEDFNLEALGMQSVKDLYQTARSKHTVWNAYEMELNEDTFLFEVAPGEIDRICDSFTYYTENDKQNQALTIAENISKSINSAIDAKMVNEHNVSIITKIAHIVSYKPNTSTGKLEVMPNYSYIKSLN